MKGVKGRFLKKLKSIKPLSSLKQDHNLLVNVSDRFLSMGKDKYREEENQMTHHCKSTLNVIDVPELMKDLEDEEMELGENVGNKENIGPMVKLKDPSMSTKDGHNNTENLILSGSRRKSSNFEIRALTELNDHQLIPNSRNTHHSSDTKTPNFHQVSSKEIDVLSFRRPDLNSSTLFDPNLLAAFEQAVMDMRAHEGERRARIEREILEREREREVEEPKKKSRRIEENPLLEFEEKCPPGGNESVILYTTSLRGIRKTFEDCSSIRFLLGNIKVLFYERDVSMHLEYKEELWSILEDRVIPPKLFIKGRYIGGADEVIGLHEQGKLLKLLEGIPRDLSNNPCDWCAGIRFIMCFKCNGSRKIENDVEGDDGLRIQCPQCNENGLLICPFCR